MSHLPTTAGRALGGQAAEPEHMPGQWRARVAGVSAAGGDQSEQAGRGPHTRTVG